MHKVIIRPLKFSDASTSYVWRNDGEVWKFTGNKPNLVVTEELERIWISEKLLEKNSNRFAIEVDDEYVGNIQLTNITYHDAEFHIFIGNKDYWGKGISYIAILQLLRYVKSNLSIKKIYLKVNPENKSAINLYKKVGFKITDDLVNMEFQLENEVFPIVSIFCMVYNHEKFLCQCLDGFLMQKCNFDFEIVVGEDCSTDKSREILLDYAERHPGKFKLILHNKNVGAIENQRIVFQNCTGKYIALCEGDDYWTDPYKLQKQVDFLEENQEYVLCGGKVNILDSRNQNNKLQYDQQYFVYDKSQETDKSHCIHEFLLPFHTSTFVFRQSALNFNQLKRIQKNCISGDIIILNLLNSNGKIYYINNIFGVQHHNANGITTHENHKGLNFLWNRVYMWQKIAKIIYRNSEFLKKSALRLSLNFEIILIGKIGNQSLSKRISFVRNTHYGQLRLFFLVLKLHIEKLIRRFWNN